MEKVENTKNFTATSGGTFSHTDMILTWYKNSYKKNIQMFACLHS